MEAIPQRKPWIEEEKKEIAAVVKNCLGIKDEWIPAIRPDIMRVLPQDGFSIEFVVFESWENVVGTAHLYVPECTEKVQCPFVIVCCGHGSNGKLCPDYQAMARRLAKQGAVVLVSDNIGQGERIPMGHAASVAPFACGMSLQGLIVMETMGWIEWAKCDQRIDSRKIAGVGNSGGGTLTLFLAALCPDLVAISSSGYPSTFEFVARKEKKHCHCNILPGIVGALEMWQVLGCFAPRPLLIFQGISDSMFPVDIFYATARKTRSAYEALNAEDAFSCEALDNGHSWNMEKRMLISTFLAKHLGLCAPEKVDDDTRECLDETYTCFNVWPEQAAATDDIAWKLTGTVPSPEQFRLWDVFPPRADDINSIDQITPRGDTRQVLAQFEAFLTHE